jgi:hypothetical protein
MLMAEDKKLSERIIVFFDNCCLGNYNSDDASLILTDIKSLESRAAEAQRILEAEYFNPTALKYIEPIKDYEHITCAEEYQDVVLKRVRAALRGGGPQVIQELGFHGVPVGKCQRCGKTAELYEEGAENMEGEWVPLMVCWDCSFTIINQIGDPFDSSEDEEDLGPLG